MWRLRKRFELFVFVSIAFFLGSCSSISSDDEMHDVQVVELFGDDEPELEPQKWGPLVVKPRRKNAKAAARSAKMSEAEMRAVAKEFDAALKAGDVTAIKTFLDLGFDVEASGIPDVRRLGYTPTVNAIVFRHPAVLKLLLDHGSDPDIRTIWLTSPMSIAAHCKQDDPVAADRCIQCIDLLLEYGAEIDGRTDDGWTPLIHAARNRNLKIVDHLLSKGANDLLRETYNNQLHSNKTDDLRDYLDHALLRSRPEWAECLRGAPQVKGNCNRVREWAKVLFTGDARPL